MTNKNLPKIFEAMNYENLESAVDTLNGFDYVQSSYSLDTALMRVIEQEGEIPLECDKGFSEEEFKVLSEVYQNGLFGTVRTEHLPRVVEEYQISDTFHDQASNLPEGRNESVIADGPQYFFRSASETSLESSIFDIQYQTVEKVFRVDGETADWSQDSSAVECDKVETLNQLAKELPENLSIPEYEEESPAEQLEDRLDEGQKQILSDSHIQVWGLDAASLQKITREILEDSRYGQAKENLDAFHNQTAIIRYNEIKPEEIQQDDEGVEKLAKKLQQENYEGRRIDSQIEIKFSRKISPRIVKRYGLRRETN